MCIGARRLFGVMPPSEERSRTAASSGEERIGSLPIPERAVLRYVLSFRLAMRRACSPRCWCDVWKSVPVLRVTGSCGGAAAFNKFVSHLCLLRECSPLMEFELSFFSLSSSM
uniref:F-box domain-containing protein n=1 Tax=Oryza meridionalis TaxID=40149 RepID=A0A0E0C2Y0_9ORYZ